MGQGQSGPCCRTHSVLPPSSRTSLEALAPCPTDPIRAQAAVRGRAVSSPLGTQQDRCLERPSLPKAVMASGLAFLLLGCGLQELRGCRRLPAAWPVPVYK